MDPLNSVILVAFLSERAVEVVKRLIKPYLANWPEDRQTSLYLIVASACGILLSFGFNINILEQYSTPFRYPAIGMVITGIFAGMGSQWIHEILINLPRSFVLKNRIEVQSLKKIANDK